MKSVSQNGAKFRDTRLAAAQADRDMWMQRAVDAEARLAQLDKVVTELRDTPWWPWLPIELRTRALALVSKESGK